MPPTCWKLSILQGPLFAESRACACCSWNARQFTLPQTRAIIKSTLLCCDDYDNDDGHDDNDNDDAAGGDDDDDGADDDDDDDDDDDADDCDDDDDDDADDDDDDDDGDDYTSCLFSIIITIRIRIMIIDDAKEENALSFLNWGGFWSGGEMLEKCESFFSSKLASSLARP